MQPVFIAENASQLFAVYYPPKANAISRAIIHIPAFAEEMNKSRRMVALQAQALAEQGYAVLVLDLYGTGDSSGDFSQATWQGWLENIQTAIAWLKQQGAVYIDLWALRTGALLAVDFACNYAPNSISKLLCWQPVLNGDTFVSQFLRLRVAAALFNSNAPQEKTADLKQQLMAGQALEVAGYLLNPELLKPLMAARADSSDYAGLEELCLIELVASADQEASFANQQFFDKLQQQPIQVSLQKAVGDSFWASQEITTAPELIHLTTTITQQWL
jgi:exosortase A-associated hydrolase 2